MTRKTISVAVALALVTTGAFMAWRHFSVDKDLAATARRQGYDVDEYIDLVALTDKCVERGETLTTQEWDRAKHYVTSGDDRFRTRAQALLRAQDKSPYRDEAIQFARGMLQDREEHVVAGALVILVRMGVSDRDELVQRYKSDLRPAVKEMAVALDTTPDSPPQGEEL